MLRTFHPQLFQALPRSKEPILWVRPGTIGGDYQDIVKKVLSSVILFHLFQTVKNFQQIHKVTISLNHLMSVSFRSNIALKNENPKLRKISVKTKLLKERNSVV